MLLKIGIVGSSATGFDPEKARALLMSAVSDIAYQLKPADIEIVSGLKNTGIPKQAYEFAERCGYKTIGIDANEVKNESYELYPVDECRFAGSNNGDESGYFVDCIDALIRVGGSTNCLHKVDLFKQKCMQAGWDVKARLVEVDL